MSLSLEGRNSLLKRALEETGPNAHLQFDAVAPFPSGKVRLQEGYQLGVWSESEAHVEIPFVAAAVRQRLLLKVFWELAEVLGDEVDVVLETSHEFQHDRHTDFFREGIGLHTLRDICSDYEKLLVSDGGTGIAVLSRNEPSEVQFDEHKTLVTFTRNTKPFENVLRRNRIRNKQNLSLIRDISHEHRMLPEAREIFEELRRLLGAEER